MDASNPPPFPAKADLDAQGWPEMSAEEEADVRAAFIRADEAYSRGECIPAAEILPRLRRAG